MSKKSNQLQPESHTAISDDSPTFEAAYQELENVVSQLERGDLPLDQTLELHERGSKLVALCIAYLEQAELKIHKLTVNNH